MDFKRTSENTQIYQLHRSHVWQISQRLVDFYGKFKYNNVWSKKKEKTNLVQMIHFLYPFYFMVPENQGVDIPSFYREVHKNIYIHIVKKQGTSAEGDEKLHQCHVKFRITGQLKM